MSKQKTISERLVLENAASYTKQIDETENQGMNFKFTADTNSSNTKEKQQLRAICRKATSLEELISQWVTRELSRELMFDKGTSNAAQTLGEPAILVTFIQSKDEIGYAEVLVEQVLKHYPDVPVVDQAKFDFSSKEFSVKVDEEWFYARDEKLGIFWDDVYFHNVVPKEHVADLLLSYVLSSYQGCADISHVDDICLEEAREEYLNEKEERNFRENFAVLHLHLVDQKTLNGTWEFCGYYIE